MYVNGQKICEDLHFLDHIVHEVPVQIYLGQEHNDIGFIEAFDPAYVKVNNTLYKREVFTFISRPGY